VLPGRLARPNQAGYARINRATPETAPRVPPVNSKQTLSPTIGEKSYGPKPIDAEVAVKWKGAVPSPNYS
jgi:hypothetical protein